MLDAIGVSSIDELFDVIPEAVRLGRSLELPDGKPETEVYDRLSGLAQRNAHAEAERASWAPGCMTTTCRRWSTRFRPLEFLTPYTPYQPEISQGGLQVIFEFQTAMSELTGLPVSNAAMYEGPSAVASAAYLAIGATGREARRLPWRPPAQPGVPGHVRRRVRDRAGRGPACGWRHGRRRLAEAIDDDTAAVFLQQPNFLVASRTSRRWEPRRRRRARSWWSPVIRLLSRSCGPGECRADIAVGEGEPARQPPRLRRALLRLLLRDRGADRHCQATSPAKRPTSTAAAASCRPSRPATAHPPGEGDAQHLHRPGAQCAGGDGPSGLARKARLRPARGASGAPYCLRARAAGAGRRRGAAARRSGRPRIRDQPGCPSPRLDRCDAEGIGAVFARSRLPEHENGLLIAITERRSRQDIDRFAEVLGTRSPSHVALRSPRGWRREQPARPGDHRDADAARPRGHHLRALGRGTPRGDPARVRRGGAPDRGADPEEPASREAGELPEISEPEIVRHYNRISRRNFDLDTGFYPLGSCTMKPTRASTSGWRPCRGTPACTRPRSRSAPRAPSSSCGCCSMLSETCGLPHVSLQPSAGSHASSPGCCSPGRTTPTGVRAGPRCSPRTRPRHQPGDGDDGRLRGGGARLQREGASTSTTCARRPVTHRLPDARRPEHARAVRREHRGDRLDRPRGGGTLYYEGANLNAIMGRSRPATWASTSSTSTCTSPSRSPTAAVPVGGPIACRDRIQPFLPRPQVVRSEPQERREPTFDLDFDRPKSIGRLRGFQDTSASSCARTPTSSASAATGSRRHRRPPC